MTSSNCQPRIRGSGEPRQHPRVSLHKVSDGCYGVLHGHTPHPTTWSLPALVQQRQPRPEIRASTNQTAVHHPARYLSNRNQRAASSMRVPAYRRSSGAADNSHRQWDKLKCLCVNLTVAVGPSSNTPSQCQTRLARLVTSGESRVNSPPSPTIRQLIAFRGRLAVACWETLSSGLVGERASRRRR